MKKKKETQDHSTRAHAKYSASGSPRWLKCSGSIELSEKAPPQSESPYAKEGTEAHECLEFLLNNRNRLLAAEKMARKKWNDDQVNHGLDAVAYVLEKADTLLVGGEVEIEAETRVDASFFTKEGQFGTTDISIIQLFGKLVIIDYKYGAGVPVSVVENSQLIYYALGMAARYDFNFEEVEMVIVQPRAEHEDGPIRSWSCSMQYLLDEWVPKFKRGVEICEDPFESTLLAGDHCRFCPAAPICPEISNKRLREAQIEFDDDTMEIETLPSVTKIAIKNLPTILEACERLEHWIESVRSHAFNVMERNETIDGYKLVKKRSTRKWSDEDKVAKLARKHFGDTAFAHPKLLSPAQFEKAHALYSTDEEKRAKKFVEKYTTNESSGFTMVKESDSRDAINYIETEFEVIEDDFTTGRWEGSEPNTLSLPRSKNPKKKGVKKMQEQQTQVETSPVVETPKKKATVKKPAAKAKATTTKKAAKKPVSKKVAPKKTVKKPATKKVVKATPKKAVKKAVKK